MQNYTVCFIGSDDTYKLLGNKATTSDLEFRHYTKNDKVITFIKPIGYPEKVKSLIQALNLSDYVIVEIERVDKELAEIIVALDITGKEGVFIVKAINQALSTQVANIIKATSIEEYNLKFIKNNEDIVNLKNELLKKESKKNDELLIILDHAFNVKSVGLVTLGFIKGGEISAREQCILQPGKRDIQVKSIQSMDLDYKNIKAKARIGLSLKNAKLEDVTRGTIIVKEEYEEIIELKGRLVKNQYYNEEIKIGTELMIINGLLITRGIIKALDEEIIITLDKPIVKTEKKTILINPNSSGLRIIGYLQ